MEIMSRVQLGSLSIGAARQENLAAAASDFLTQLNAELGSKLQGIGMQTRWISKMDLR